MANKPIPAVCDHGCKKSFSISKFKTQKVKAGNEKTFFRCPHCRQEYVAYYSSIETKQLQKKIRKLQKEAYAPGSATDMNVFRQQEAILQAQIKHSMDEARMVSES